MNEYDKNQTWLAQVRIILNAAKTAALIDCECEPGGASHDLEPGRDCYWHIIIGDMEQFEESAVEPGELDHG